MTLKFKKTKLRDIPKNLGKVYNGIDAFKIPVDTYVLVVGEHEAGKILIRLDGKYPFDTLYNPEDSSHTKLWGTSLSAYKFQVIDPYNYKHLLNI